MDQQKTGRRQNPGQKMDHITFEEGMKLFDLPRHLGETAEGEAVSASIGRFGPYVKYASKFVSLKDEDPHVVTLERALEIIQAKKEFDANKIIATFTEEGIEVLNGRFGPYVTDGERNARIAKDVDPKSLTLADCKVLLENAPIRKRGKKKVAKKTVTKKVVVKKATKKKVTKKKSTKKKATKKKASKKTSKKVAKKKIT